MKKILINVFNKKLRSNLSILLVFVMLITGISTSIPIYASEKNNNIMFSERMNDLVIRSENSFGNLLASELDAKMNEQKENNGCNIFSIEVNGKEAAVSFETVQDCTLVVGIYDEAGEKMLASGSREVLSGETDVVVFIETGSMPQYFYVKGFLVDTNSFRPLCIAYESPNYTKEMQDFFAKTTDDFAQDKVINFDDDKTSNFAVFSENTKVIQESAVSNQVIRADDEQNIYVIENADSNIASLQVGDIFAQKYDDNNVLIVKIASIQTDGTTVTITGEETSLEEVFDYVKIEGESKAEDAVVDTSNCEEGVVYNGLAETQYQRLMDSEETVEGEYYGLELEEKIGKTFSFDFVDKKIGSDDNNVKVNGGLNLGIECTVKAYVSLSYSYLELKLDYSAQVNFSITGNAHGELPLISLGFLPAPGVIIEFTPSIIVEASAKIDLTGKLSGTVGFSVSSKDGAKNLTSTPTFQTTVKIEGKVYIVSAD